MGWDLGHWVVEIIKRYYKVISALQLLHAYRVVGEELPKTRQAEVQNP